MNKDIIQAFFSTLSSANLGYPIAWPNVDFTPPPIGYWLEVSHFPNSGIDVSLSAQQVIRQGIFQVSVMGRQNTGVLGMADVCDEVAAVFPKLTTLSTARVSKMPYAISAVAIDNGKIELPLTIEYSE